MCPRLLLRPNLLAKPSMESIPDVTVWDVTMKLWDRLPPPALLRTKSSCLPTCGLAVLPAVCSPREPRSGLFLSPGASPGGLPAGVGSTSPQGPQIRPFDVMASEVSDARAHARTHTIEEACAGRGGTEGPRHLPSSSSALGCCESGFPPTFNDTRWHNRDPYNFSYIYKSWKGLTYPKQSF